MKTDANGDTLWTNSVITAQSLDNAASTNGYIIVGSADGEGAFIRTDSTGYTLWTETYGSPILNDCILKSIRRTSDNGYIAVGYGHGLGPESNDVWLVRMGPDLTLLNDRGNYITPDYYNRSIVSGPFQFPEETTYQIFDITGRQIHTLDPAPGIYFIEVDGKVQQKVVKVR